MKYLILIIALTIASLDVAYAQSQAPFVINGNSAGLFARTRPELERPDVHLIIGALARAGREPADGFFVVTSRASYELVQKTAVAGAPLLAAVSRPTGLAIRFAEEAGIALVGLVRGDTANVYSHTHRVVS